MESKKWLEELKKGDTVVVERKGWGHYSTIEKVVGFTKQHIKVGGSKFRRESGFEAISSRTGGWLREATPKLVASVELEARRRMALHKCEFTNWRGLSTSKLERIAAILDEPEAQNGE